MKKLILLLTVLTLGFTSCNSDDDAATSQDAFIGTWKFTAEFENGVSIPLDDCEDEETIVVSSNGVITITYFDEDVDGNCIADTMDSESGTWENLGNSVYSFSFNGDSNEDEIVFQGNTFTITDTYIFDGETFTDEYVYTRI